MVDFLLEENDLKNYQNLVSKAVKDHMIVGTFSTSGPLKCSGLEIKQQDKISLTSTFDAHFDKIECFTIDHKTPFDTLQNFIFCSFKHR